MTHRAHRAGLLAATLLLCAVASACDSQAAVRPGASAAATPLPAAGGASPYPQTRAPYDETPITPMETVGAARSE